MLFCSSNVQDDEPSDENGDRNQKTSFKSQNFEACFLSSIFSPFYSPASFSSQFRTSATAHMIYQEISGENINYETRNIHHYYR